VIRPWHPRLRPELTLADESSPSSPLLHDPLLDRAIRFDPSARPLLLALDGTRPLRALAAAHGAAETERVLRRLLLLHLLEGAGDEVRARIRRVKSGEETVPISVLHEGRFECLGTGDCCRSYSFGPLTPEDVARLEGLDIAARLPQAGPGPWVVERRTARSSAPLPYLKSVDERCVFLLEDGRCGIHAAFGAEKKPAFCRIFPYSAYPTIEGLKVWDNGECSRFSQTARRGLPVVQDLDRITALLPADLALQHPMVRADERTSYDYAFHLGFQRAAVDLVGRLKAPPLPSVVAALRLARRLSDALAACPLEPEGPAAAAARALAADPGDLLGPPAADRVPGLRAIARLALELWKPVSNLAGTARPTPHGLLSAAQFRELSQVLHMVGALALARAGTGGAPLLPSYERAAALPAGGPDVAEVCRISLRQQLFGSRILVGEGIRAGALRVLMTLLATFAGARLRALLRGAPRVALDDLDAGHKLAQRIFRNPAVAPVFLEHEAGAWDAVEAAAYMGGGM
jgi:Fe-S-cluster containining protein